MGVPVGTIRPRAAGPTNPPSSPARSAFAGSRFARKVVVLAVRWVPRFGLSYRDVEELAAERDIAGDHVTVHRWMQRFTPLLADAVRFGRHRVGDRCHVDDTYVKVAGRWVYLYRAVDQFGQVIDVCASARRDGEAARRFFQRAAKATGVVPAEVVTDHAPTCPQVLDALWPAAWHHVERNANNRVEADHAQLTRRLRPMRGIKTMTGLRVLAAGHVFVRNLGRGHYEIAADEPTQPSTPGGIPRTGHGNLRCFTGRPATPACATTDCCNRPAARTRHPLRGASAGATVKPSREQEALQCVARAGETLRVQPQALTSLSERRRCHRFERAHLGSTECP
jgi:transposase-like protein